MIEELIMPGLPLLSMALALGAPVAAWLRRPSSAWAMVAVGWLIWPLLLVIGLLDNPAHGTGALYYLEMWAILGLPIATIVAAVIGGIVALINRKRLVPSPLDQLEITE